MILENCYLNLGLHGPFAVDDNEIKMCTKLAGKKSWFLPFNKGYNDEAGNPPNPEGLKTDYLWKRDLERRVNKYHRKLRSNSRREGSRN